MIWFSSKRLISNVSVLKKEASTLLNAPVTPAPFIFAPASSLVISARKQIGVVTSYDGGYYEGGYPPENTGVCTDVVERALRDNGFILKKQLDADMKAHPEKYPPGFDSNINFRRVRNIRIFLTHYAESLPICAGAECTIPDFWQPGDIITYDQIPGSLWHIAIVSNQAVKTDTATGAYRPLIIHNYGSGVREDDLMTTWPAPMTGHYRLSESFFKN